MNKSLYRLFIVLPLVILPCLFLLYACGAWEVVPPASPNAIKAFEVPDRSKRYSTPTAIKEFVEETKKVDDYLLYDGDDVNIEVIGRPELSGVQTIGPDGRISLSVVGSLLVRNLTREQTAEAVTKALSPYYANVFTTVRVERYKSNRIIIIGRVEHPGEILFNSAPYLMDIIAQAGGMPLMRKDQVLTRCAIIRKDTILWVDLGHLLTGDTSLNIPLQRHDVIYIPDSSDTAVVVLGAVNLPGVKTMSPQMSFIDAIGQAGGITRDGNTEEVHLIRPSENVHLVIDMAKILAPQKELNVAINEGDIIYVPRHSVSKVSYIMQQINPFSTLMSISQLGAAMP